MINKSFEKTGGSPLPPHDLIFIAALVLLAICAYLVGFNFWAALGFSLALGLVFYLVQGSLRRPRNTPRR